MIYDEFKGLNKEERQKKIIDVLKSISVTTKVVNSDKEIVEVNNPIEALSAMGYTIDWISHLLDFELSGRPLMMEVGKSYLSQRGEIVLITRNTSLGASGAYDTATDNKGVPRYNRAQNSGRDNGRICGSKHDYSDLGNLEQKLDDFVGRIINDDFSIAYGTKVYKLSSTDLMIEHGVKYVEQLAASPEDALEKVLKVYPLNNSKGFDIILQKEIDHVNGEFIKAD